MNQIRKRGSGGVIAGCTRGAQLISGGPGFERKCSCDTEPSLPWLSCPWRGGGGYGRRVERERAEGQAPAAPGHMHTHMGTLTLVHTYTRARARTHTHTQSLLDSCTPCSPCTCPSIAFTHPPPCPDHHCSSLDGFSGLVPGAPSSFSRWSDPCSTAI